jgi:hypothetical protein
MAKRLGSIGKLKHPKGPHKTAKRLAVKKTMLATKAAKKLRGKVSKKVTKKA